MKPQWPNRTAQSHLRSRRERKSENSSNKGWTHARGAKNHPTSHFRVCMTPRVIKLGQKGASRIVAEGRPGLACARSLKIPMTWVILYSCQLILWLYSRAGRLHFSRHDDPMTTSWLAHETERESCLEGGFFVRDFSLRVLYTGEEASWSGQSSLVFTLRRADILRGARCLGVVGLGLRCGLVECSDGDVIVWHWVGVPFSRLGR